MTDRELLQMALDALEAALSDDQPYISRSKEIVEALRARLAQPEPLAQFKFQEYGPPNWGESQVTKPEFVAEQKAMNEALRTMVEPAIQARKEGDLIVVDLPQVPRGSGGITKDEQPEPILPGGGGGSGEPTIDGWPLWSGLPKPEPEPVAWMWDVYSGAGYTSRGIDFYPTNIPFAKHTPLYTTPPQREWQGLTDSEKKDICQEAANEDWTDLDVINATEAKLKEKNT